MNHLGPECLTSFAFGAVGLAPLRCAQDGVEGLEDDMEGRGAIARWQMAAVAGIGGEYRLWHLPIHCVDWLTLR